MAFDRGPTGSLGFEGQESVDYAQFDITKTTPEPSTLALFGTGLLPIIGTLQQKLSSTHRTSRP